MVKALAKSVMRAFPAQPSPKDISLFEIFQTQEYLRANAAEQNRVKLQSAEYRYQCELDADFFQMYFPTVDPLSFRGKAMLDLGSFTGGRLIRWAEKYGLGNPVGIDIEPLFAEAGQLFAAQKGISAHFHTGYAEDLPFGDEEFDVVVAFDVFEHVRSVSQAMSECLRILKPNGILLTAFPQYFQPAESHLGLVTRAPALHWFFSGRTLTAAYYEITKERGNDADWYARESPDLEPWERMRSLNGITVRRFRDIVRSQSAWKLIYWSTRPIFHGRARRGGLFAAASTIFGMAARLPILEELFLGRICCVLEKRGEVASSGKRLQ